MRGFADHLIRPAPGDALFSLRGRGRYPTPYWNVWRRDMSESIKHILEELEQRYEGVSCGDRHWGVEHRSPLSGMCVLDRSGRVIGGKFFRAPGRTDDPFHGGVEYEFVFNEAGIPHDLLVPGFGHVMLTRTVRGRSFDVFDTMPVTPMTEISMSLGGLLMFLRLMDRRCGECGAPVEPDTEYLW